MAEFKIYTDNFHVLEKVCSDYNLEPDYVYNPIFKTLPENLFGYGYCSDGKYLRVFCEGSYIDQDETLTDITSQYISPKFTL